jgi:hypothetical protein
MADLILRHKTSRRAAGQVSNLLNFNDLAEQSYSTITAVPLAETISMPLSFPIIS